MSNRSHANRSNPSSGLAAGLILGVAVLVAGVFPSHAETRLLNASYDISRELFQQINTAFTASWKRQTGEAITLRQSHGGSSKQARSVLDGLEADVVTFNQATDIDILATRGHLLPANWRTLLPHDSAPYSSTIVFLVRQRNPKDIRDWPDLVRPQVGVIVPNPKTSGNGRYSYLAAWAYAVGKLHLDADQARAFVAKLFRNVPVLDTGGRGALTTFAQNGIGDVLLTFEAEVQLALQEFGSGRFEQVIPSYSVDAAMPVAVVEKVVRRRGTEKAARAYLEFLYTEEGQEIIARNHYRPRSETIAKKYSDRFGRLELFQVETVFGSWEAAHKTHFAEGGIFDRISQPPIQR